MTYSEMVSLYKNKFSKATVNQCNFAIKDIDEILKLHMDKDTSHPYVAKLFVERDAAIARKFNLAK